MVVFPAPDKPEREDQWAESPFGTTLGCPQGRQPASVTSEPDGAASEASSGAHDLPSLASTDMVGLVHHIGWSL